MVFAVEDNFPILSTPLALDILKLSQTVYPASVPAAGTLSHMPLREGEFPFPPDAIPAAFYLRRFDRRLSRGVNNLPCASNLPPLWRSFDFRAALPDFLSRLSRG